MSNTSLAAKYRPQHLGQFLGNEATVHSLKATLEREEIPHSMLFTGPSGCGKTTLARIVAAKLRCSKFDLTELNTADFRGIDTIRDLIRVSSLAPMSGPCRVWIMDECHQLSKDAQHALLKLLEDSPKHAYLLLATTEPDKLLATIKTRCVTFDLQPLPDKEMRGLVMRTVDAENAEVPEEVVDQIVQDSLGSPRMALTILDKVIGMTQDAMLEAAQQQAVQQNEAIELCRALIQKRPWPQVAKTLKGLSQDPEQVRRAVLGYASSVLLGKDAGQAYIVMMAFKEPLYDTGRPGLVMACYEAVNG